MNFITLQSATSLLLFMAWSTQSASSQDIIVNVTHLSAPKGQVIVALFDSKATFLKKAFMEKKVMAAELSVSVTFKEVPPGKYAVSIIHDENKNGNLDTNWLGIPNEGYGFGNNATGTFGPASFEDSSFQISQTGAILTIKAKYH